MKAGIRVWIDMFGELLEFRGLIWRLIIRDLSARYKQSIFGILWAFITPLVMMPVVMGIEMPSWIRDDDTALCQIKS